MVFYSCNAIHNAPSKTYSRSLLSSVVDSFTTNQFSPDQPMTWTPSKLDLPLSFSLPLFQGKHTWIE